MAAVHPTLSHTTRHRLFQIKICGVTSAADAQIVAQAGADAVGLNFFSPSPRSVDAEQAKAVVAHLPAGVQRVGVFVNHAADEVLRLAETLSLDWIQLHGDEPPEAIAEYGGHKLIRAFRCRDADVSTVHEYLARCSSPPDAVLIDAYAPGAYGGTGQVVDWEVAQRLASQLLPLPLILAGGLQSQNVSAAIRAVGPRAVDTASGVESAPGRKDGEQVAEFVRQAQQAFAGQPPGDA